MYVKYILVGATMMLMIKWIIAVCITTVTLKLNYQKALSMNFSMLDSIKMVIVPSMIYVFTETFSLIVLSISAKLFLTGDAKMFFSSFVSSVAFILAVIVFYILLKNSLVKNAIETSLAKSIADNAIKYYVLILILIGAISTFL
jgi:hypothetical protein